MTAAKLFPRGIIFYPPKRLRCLLAERILQTPRERISLYKRGAAFINLTGGKYVGGYSAKK